MAVMIWFDDIGIKVKLALFLFQFSRNLHTPFDFTFQYTTFLERTGLACLISILNGSLF